MISVSGLCLCLRDAVLYSGLCLCLRDAVLYLTTNWNRDCAVVA